MNFKTCLIAMCFSLYVSCCFASGNGSSGVGNHLLNIGKGLDTYLANAKTIRKNGEYLIDAETTEKLIKIGHINPSEFAHYRGRWVPSNLGNLNGFEYLPDESEIGKKNEWAVCTSANDCILLSPISESNVKVQNIVGGLRKSNGK